MNMFPNSPSTLAPRTCPRSMEDAMTHHPLVGLMAACSVSLVAHGIAYASLAFAPKQHVEPPPSRVAFRVHEPEAPKPPPRKPAEAEPPAPERHANAPKPKAPPPV